MLHLIRYPEQNGGTPGQINFQDQIICFTLELPWRGNRPGASCIPMEKYKIDYTYSPRFKKNTYEVLQVPGRIGIRIHSANFIHQLHGCIAPGFDIDWRANPLIIKESRKALEILEEVISYNSIDSIRIS